MLYFFWKAANASLVHGPSVPERGQSFMDWPLGDSLQILAQDVRPLL